ncbi:MAG: ABC transporter permease [Betaproteobacteria bacterium]|nr:ABC transporter permease [Betaproteobacteria bacterium]
MRRAIAGSGGLVLSGAVGAWRLLHFGAEAVVAALSPSTYTPPARALAARQVCSSAWQILPGFVVVCSLLSYLVIGIINSTARDFGLSGYALDLFVRVLVLELVPVFVALFVALRSGAAIGTEVALMRVRGELDSLREGAHTLRAELLPRGIGVAVSVLALTAIGILVALVVAYVGLYGFSPWGHAAYSRAIGQVFGSAELAGLGLKVVFFALAVAVIPVAASLGSSPDPGTVPEAAPRGLVRLFVGLALVEAASLALTYA